VPKVVRKQQVRPDKPMSSQSNDIFMKKKVGNLGKLRGLNLEKARLSNIKTENGNSMVELPNPIAPFQIPPEEDEVKENPFSVD
jgi:hypothetical protein